MTHSSQPSESGRLTISIDPDLEDIVPGFLENRRKDVSTLHTAMKSNDLKTVRLLGHRMKGDGGSYGFDAIGSIGDAIEQAAMREDLVVISEQIDRLRDFLSRIEVVYRK
ncbi:MAG TPA: Hpt domain-containing protein [Nitrospira sp.]